MAHTALVGLGLQAVSAGSSSPPSTVAGCRIGGWLTLTSGLSRSQPFVHLTSHRSTLWSTS